MFPQLYCTDKNLMISKMTFYSDIYNFIVSQDCIVCVCFFNISSNVPQPKYIEFASENLGN